MHFKVENMHRFGAVVPLGWVMVNFLSPNPIPVVNLKLKMAIPSKLERWT